jgi:hypothetical protein
VPDPTKLHGCIRLLATLALLVLVFGLPRLLRTCDHGDHRHLVVAFGGCEHPGHGDADDERDRPVRHDEEGCSSSGNAFEVGTPPRPFELALAPAAPISTAVPWLPPAAQRRPRPLPPATGPPRPDDRTALRRTTRLQV